MRMISLTPEAIANLKSVFSERGEFTGLRIAVAGSGPSGFKYRMTLDREAGVGDKVIELDGLKIFVDAKSLIYLNGTKVDYVKSKDGAGFTFDNPNVKLLCGHGETFEA